MPWKLVHAPRSHVCRIAKKHQTKPAGDRQEVSACLLMAHQLTVSLTQHVWRLNGQHTTRTETSARTACQLL